MSLDPKARAINAALNNNWQEAILINHNILKENPNDTESLNRLAYAFIRCGQISKGKKIYQKVLNIDAFNTIALKNIKRAGTLGAKKNLLNQDRLVPDLFIEEPGKCKVVCLVNTAPAKILYGLTVGQILDYKIKRFTIEIRHNKTYIGVLPDDLSFRLKKFMALGYRYEIYIKNIAKNNLVVLIKETKRSSRAKNQPSFIFADNHFFNTLPYQKTAPLVSDTEADEESCGE